MEKGFRPAEGGNHEKVRLPEGCVRRLWQFGDEIRQDEEIGLPTQPLGDHVSCGFTYSNDCSRTMDCDSTQNLRQKFPTSLVMRGVLMNHGSLSKNDGKIDGRRHM